MKIAGVPVPSGNVCINHPDRKAVAKHLCKDCLRKWEAEQIQYSTIMNHSVDFSETD